MSYDTVALVAREPDLETVTRVLEDTAPGLWLHPHPDTALLELRDDDGALLATVEPGLAMASRQEIGRLLGQDTQDSAPDPCWWVETRARPDEAGRRVADDFAQVLVDRLGGTVWTSGPADSEFRPGPGVDGGAGSWAAAETDTGHPAADRVTDSAVLVTQDRAVVPWSSWLADAAINAGRDRMLQLRTPRSSRLTLSTWTAVTNAHGMWVVQDGHGGHFDGMTGLPLTWDGLHGFVRHLPDPPGKRSLDETGQVPQGPVPAFLAPPPTGTHLEVRLSIVHPADEPRIGCGAEILGECLSGPPPAAWDLHEPLTRPWDPARMLNSARRRAPERLLLHFAGPWEQGHPYVGRIGLTWAGDVLTEEVTLVVGLEPGAERQSLARLAETVKALGERDLLDTLWARRFVGRPDTTHEPTWRGLGSALGIGIGPRRVESVGLEATESGPLPGTPFGPPEHRSVWYPALGDVDDPRRAMKALRAQWQHLADHAQQ